MAKFLNTTGISFQLEEIIKSAQDRLWLISPFLKVNQRIKQLLEDTNRLKIDSRVIYGKNELQPEENIWLESMSSIRTMFCRDLHAKCYLNEEQALLTSMNLYEYSQVNNYEMGILVTRTVEPELYEDMYQECRRILRASEEIRVTVARVPTSEVDKGTATPRASRARATPQVGKPTNGFCIRCKADLKADPSKPYCQACHQVWNRFKNQDYEEKHCHTCGTDHKTSLRKPLCAACYGKYREVLDFAAN